MKPDALALAIRDVSSIKESNFDLKRGEYDAQSLISKLSPFNIPDAISSKRRMSD